MRKRKNRIYSKQVLHLTSTPPLSKIRSAGILSIWQKETTSSHIWTAIKFEYFDLTKIRFFEIPWFFPDFQQNFKFPDFSLQGFFFSPFSLFSLFSRVRGHPDIVSFFHDISHLTISSHDGGKHFMLSIWNGPFCMVWTTQYRILTNPPSEQRILTKHTFRTDRFSPKEWYICKINQNI